MIGIVVGMRSEARLLPGGAIACSGGAPERAYELTKRMLDGGVAGVLSFGIAGALDPRLRSGSLVVGNEVEVGASILRADEGWTHRLSHALPQASIGLILGGEEVAATPAAKQALHRQSGAVAVDLESGAVAEACLSAGRPFAVLRAIADPAERGIPLLATAGLGADGSTRPLAVACGLLRRPQDLPALVRLGLETRAALSALGAAVAILGVTLGFEPL